MSLTQSRETRDLPNAGAIPLSTHAPFSHPSKLCQGGLLASSARTALFLRSTFVQRVRELQRSFYTSCLQVYQGPWRTPSTVEFPQLGILHIMKSANIIFCPVSTISNYLFEVSIKVRSGSGAPLFEFKKGAIATLATFGLLISGSLVPSWVCMNVTYRLEFRGPILRSRLFPKPSREDSCQAQSDEEPSHPSG